MPSSIEFIKKIKRNKEDILFYHVHIQSTSLPKNIFLFNSSVPVKRVIQHNGNFLLLLNKKEFDNILEFEKLRIININAISIKDILINFMKNFKRKKTFTFCWHFPCVFFYKKSMVSFPSPSVLLSFSINYFTKYFFEKFLLIDDVKNFIAESKYFLKLLSIKIDIIKENKLIYTQGKITMLYDKNWRYYYLLVFSYTVFNLMFNVDKNFFKI